MDLGVYTRAYEVEDRSWLGSEDGTDVTQTITLDVTTFNPGEHYPRGYIKSGTVLGKITASGLYGPYGGATNAVQTVTVVGGPTGGTFTLTLDTHTTAAIKYNAPASAVQTAIQALTGVGVGNVVVTGGPGPDGVAPMGPGAGPGVPYTVAFLGTLAGTDVDTMTSTATSLTGGDSPDVTVAVAETGATSVSDGRETPAGFLFNTTQIGKPGYARMPSRVGAPLLWRGVIRSNRLPVTSGLDDTAIAALAGRFLIWTR